MGSVWPGAQVPCAHTALSKVTIQSTAVLSPALVCASVEGWQGVLCIQGSCVWPHTCIGITISTMVILQAPLCCNLVQAHKFLTTEEMRVSPLFTQQFGIGRRIDLCSSGVRFCKAQTCHLGPSAHREGTNELLPDSLLECTVSRILLHLGY